MLQTKGEPPKKPKLRQIKLSNEIRPQAGPQWRFLSSHADIAIYGGAAGAGKALYNGSMIPTIDGLKRVADLLSGDIVFGIDGNQTEILAVSPVMTGHKCWKLTFDDGSEIVADDEHVWLTFDAKELAQLTRYDPRWRSKRREKRVSKIGGEKSAIFTASIVARNKSRTPKSRPLPTGSLRTTAQIAETLKTAKGRCNHAVPLGGCLNLADAVLPIDPYVLGLWLGDGTTGSGGFTSDDAEIIESVRKAGFHIRRNDGDPYGWVIGTVKRIQRANGRGLGMCNDFAAGLRRVGVLHDKHVPSIYLRSSRHQRLAILQGLMDTDGTVCRRSGSAEFTNTNQSLADAVLELACSLGHKANISEGIAKLNGRIISKKWVVRWVAPEIVFRLKRKAALQKINSRRTCKFRYIIGCQPTDSVPVQCIKVAAKDGMFLTGRTMIPTHNTMALLLEASRNVRLPNYSAVIFRRTYPEITAPGGMWPESMQIYPYLGGRPNATELSWKFPSGAIIKFGHLQYGPDVLKWLGSQVAMIGFDQLEVFEAEQFWYMLSRNRSMCGIRPYIRGTANPQPGWLADLLAWWIDSSTGYPIQERSGVIRWFARIGDEIKWADSAQAIIAENPEAAPKSMTFVPAKLTDNKKLMEADPGYMANLEALPRIERQRLKDGNWLISNTGAYWPAEFFDGIFFDEWPHDWKFYKRVIACDPSKGKADASGDPSAWVWMAVDADLTCWFDADIDAVRPVEPLQSQPSMPSIVTDGLRIVQSFSPVGILIEVNGFQEWVARAMLRIGTSRGMLTPIYTVNHLMPKPQRIKEGWDTLLSQRRVRVRNTPGGRALVQMLRVFKTKPDPGTHDDGPDAGAACVELYNHLVHSVDADGSIVQALRS